MANPNLAMLIAMAQAMGAKVRRSQRAAPLSPVTQTLDAAELGEHDGIRLREHLAATLAPTADGAVVRSRVADFRVTTDELGAVSQLLSCGVATVSDLGLELARRLLLAGLAVHH